MKRSSVDFAGTSWPVLHALNISGQDAAVDELGLHRSLVIGVDTEWPPVFVKCADPDRLRPPRSSRAVRSRRPGASPWSSPWYRLHAGPAFS